MMLKVLEQLSPVPITITAIEYPDDLGVFYWGDSIAPFSGRRIEISEHLQQSQRIAVLSHEVGHALCYGKGCKCFENSDILEREIHAHKYSLRFLLKHKQKESLKWMTKDIVERSHNNDVFKKILKHLMKLKLWQKCLDYVNSTTTGAESEVTNESRTSRKKTGVCTSDNHAGKSRGSGFPSCNRESHNNRRSFASIRPLVSAACSVCQWSEPRIMERPQQCNMLNPQPMAVCNIRLRFGITGRSEVMSLT